MSRVYHGQWNTDQVIETYFPGQERGFCVEVGSYDGCKGSNTKYFEDIGWKTLCIEANPNIYGELRKNRKGDCVCAACSEFPGESTLHVVNFKSGIQSSLTSLELDERLVRDYKDAIVSVEEVNVKKFRLTDLLFLFQVEDVDFVSIDTEGSELDVLKGFDLKIFKPELLVVEDNYDDHIVDKYLKDFGYVRDQRYKVNNFFLRK